MIINYHRLSSIIINYHQVSSIIIDYHQLSSIIINYHQFLSSYPSIYPSMIINSHQFTHQFIINLPQVPFYKALRQTSPAPCPSATRRSFASWPAPETRATRATPVLRRAWRPAHHLRSPMWSWSLGRREWLEKGTSLPILVRLDSR